MGLEQRIKALEETAYDPGWPATCVELYVTDGRLNPPDPEPDRLQMVVRAGTPQKRGEVFHRMPDESEQEFIERAR
jgi:hypothetical protein